MNQTLKYGLIGGAILVGGYVIYTRTQNTQPAQKTPVAQVLDSIAGLVGKFKARMTPSNSAGPSAGPADLPGGLAGVMGDSPSVYSNEGGALGVAIADGRGLRKTNGITPVPGTYMSRSEQAFAGVLPNKFSKIR